MYKKHMDGGGIFVDNNQTHDKSWALPCKKMMARQAGGHIAEADACMFGLNTWGEHWSQIVLAKMPTRFMSSSWFRRRELNRRCDGRH